MTVATGGAAFVLARAVGHPVEAAGPGLAAGPALTTTSMTGVDR